MQVSMTFRHMDSSQATQLYAQDKFDKIKKFFREPTAAHLVFEVNKHHVYTADFQLTLQNGTVFNAVETAHDLHAAIDLVMSKMEGQVRKYKERIREHS